MKEGIDAVIVDSVLRIRKGLQDSDGTSTIRDRIQAKGDGGATEKLENGGIAS